MSLSRAYYFPSSRHLPVSLCAVLTLLALSLSLLLSLLSTGNHGTHDPITAGCKITFQCRSLCMSTTLPIHCLPRLLFLVAAGQLFIPYLVRSPVCLHPLLNDLDERLKLSQRSTRERGTVGEKELAKQRNHSRHEAWTVSCVPVIRSFSLFSRPPHAPHHGEDACLQYPPRDE